MATEAGTIWLAGATGRQREPGEMSAERAARRSAMPRASATTRGNGGPQRSDRQAANVHWTAMDWRRREMPEPPGDRRVKRGARTCAAGPACAPCTENSKPVWWPPDILHSEADTLLRLPGCLPASHGPAQSLRWLREDRAGCTRRSKCPRGLIPSDPVPAGGGRRNSTLRQGGDAQARSARAVPPSPMRRGTSAPALAATAAARV